MVFHSTKKDRKTSITKMLILSARYKKLNDYYYYYYYYHYKKKNGKDQDIKSGLIWV